METSIFYSAGPNRLNPPKKIAKGCFPRLIFAKTSSDILISIAHFKELTPVPVQNMNGLLLLPTTTQPHIISVI